MTKKITSTSVFTKEEKEEKIKKEIARLNRIFKTKCIDAERLKIGVTLIENIAFLRVEAEDLREQIKETGSVQQYKNGANQYGWTQGAAASVYDKVFKNIMSATKQLNELLPKSEVASDNDGLDDFINGREC